MAGKTKIMVVEDESIIAESLQEALQNLGYRVSAIASTGEGAIRATEETKPDLVLMDIMLKGEMDGIEAAGVITAKLETPVVYLTALADDGTLERAKKTAPLGYILKPFGIEELKTSIEIALHNEVLLKKLKRSHRWLSNAFDGMGYGVIACDEDGRIMFLNVTAERVTGWSEKDVFGQALKMVLKTDDGEIIPLPRKGEGSGRGSPMVELRAVEGAPLCTKSGAVIAVDVSPIAVSDDLGNRVGVVTMLRESVTRTEVVPGLGREGDRDSYAEYYEPVRVLLISASAITEEGIRGIVGPHADIEIIGCASVQSEIPSLLEQGKPHVLFIDYAFPELDIETILDLITTSGLETQVLFLLHTQDEEAIVRAISAGGKGCIVYSSDSSKFIQAIKTVSRGNLWLDADVLTKMLARLVSRARGATEVLKAGLTKREEEIVRLVVQGYSNKRISSELYITEKTVKAHMTSTFKKLGVHSRLELALKYRG